MNKIERTVSNMKDMLRKSSLLSSEKISELDELQNSLIEDAYKRKDIELLVNTGRINISDLNVGEMQIYDDYKVITGRKRFDDDFFRTEEEYKEYLRKYKCEVKFGICLIRSKDDSELLDDEVYDTREEVEAVLPTVELEENEKAVIVYVPLIDDSICEDSLYDKPEDAEKYLDEEIEENLSFHFDTFDCLDVEYDEVAYNEVYSFGNNYAIVEEIAEKCGLGILEMNKSGDRYLFLTGCGMDMSFMLVQYMALKFNKIDEEYLSKLEWTRLNTSDEEWNEILECLGVDIQRLNKEQ